MRLFKLIDGWAKQIRMKKHVLHFDIAFTDNYELQNHVILVPTTYIS